MSPTHIRMVALCVFRRNGAILVFEGYDTVRQLRFFRPLGGGVEPGETSRVAVEREIHEELGQRVRDLKLLGVLESIFTLQGEPKHEVVFIYDGMFEEESIYAREELLGVEADGAPLRARWRALQSFNDNNRLVPEGLHELITSPSK